MRVSLRNQYSNFLYNLQNTQSRLMELNMQASSQKRINKPSDDPVGTGRVLNYRSSLASIDQYRSNIDTAKGWLNLADESMIQVSTLLTKLKGLAEQGATGTMAASDREATSYEVRQIFSQLVNLGNTRYEGKSIFGGQKFEGSAFEEALMVYDQDGKSLGLVTGQASRSFVVQFVGEEGAPVNAAGVDCRYSKDGGATWTSTTVAADGTLDLGGISLNLGTNYMVNLTPETNVSTARGSWLTIAPTAIYKGDHESQSAVIYTAGQPDVVAKPLGGFEKDVTVAVAAVGANLEITVSAEINGTTGSWVTTIPNSTSCVVETPYGQVRLAGANLDGAEFVVKSGSTGVMQMGAAVNAEGRGLFSSDVMVRIDNDPLPVDIGSGVTIDYSYSTDGGVNWSTGHTASNAGAQTELLVPGGKLVLSARGGEVQLVKNAQFIIHPQTAAHNVEISAGQYLQLNNIGSDIFGGFFEYGSQARVLGF
jgi:flagellar hook-associated protein 3 FlgL